MKINTYQKHTLSSGPRKYQQAILMVSIYVLSSIINVLFISGKLSSVLGGLFSDSLSHVFSHFIIYHKKPFPNGYLRINRKIIGLSMLNCLKFLVDSWLCFYLNPICITTLVTLKFSLIHSLNLLIENAKSRRTIKSIALYFGLIIVLVISSLKIVSFLTFIILGFFFLFVSIKQKIEDLVPHEDRNLTERNAGLITNVISLALLVVFRRDAYKLRIIFPVRLIFDTISKVSCKLLLMHSARLGIYKGAHVATRALKILFTCVKAGDEVSIFQFGVISCIIMYLGFKDEIVLEDCE